MHTCIKSPLPRLIPYSLTNFWKVYWNDMNVWLSLTYIKKINEENSKTNIWKTIIPGAVFTKLFRIRIKIRLKLKILLLWTFFKTYYTCNYLTIDCLYLIKYVLQTRLLRILSFFMKEKVNFIVETVMKICAH